MISDGAEQCAICSLPSWQCDHDVVRWSKDADELEPCPLAKSVAAVAGAAAQVLVRARCLRIAPRAPELRRAYEVQPEPEPLDDAQPDCMEWVLDLLESWPGVWRTDDETRTILWATDADGLRLRLDELRIRVEVEFCVHPGELRAVTNHRYVEGRDER